MTKGKRKNSTIRDVAKKAGVSVASVSRYINQNAPLSSEVSAKVQAAMSELKFVPHIMARRLATNKTKTIGLLVTDFYGDFFLPMFHGIESVTDEAGFDLLISSSARTGPRKEFPSSLGPHNTDGMLVFWDSLSETGIHQAYERGFPIVLIHQSPPDGLTIPCITVENKAASKRMVEHLIDAHGRRRIVFLRGPANNEDSQWRETGYRQALETKGLRVDAQLMVDGQFDRGVAEVSIQKLLSAGIAFDAVYACDDESAVGVYSALLSAGKRIPEDVSVVGFDDQRFAAYLNPPLTTIRAHTEDVGRIAARQLLKTIRNEPTDPLTLVPTEIIFRWSCGCGEE
jgi:LacI family transcriptional regulator